MATKCSPVIFGEILFDCFPDGHRVLGGAPFNVAWHLQAFGDRPRFISSIGRDEYGKEIQSAMEKWDMNLSDLQVDEKHQSGRVEVTVRDNEPNYLIVPDCAYDFIAAREMDISGEEILLYHGTLALRNPVSRKAFEKLAAREETSTFLDVNLRPPWWNREDLSKWLKAARWVKLNDDELMVLGYGGGDIMKEMELFQDEYGIDLLIVTRGQEGAIVREKSGKIHSAPAAPVDRFADTVGAGDAFTSVFIHGLISDWEIEKALSSALRFASAVVGLRGATTEEKGFYSAFDFIN